MHTPNTKLGNHLSLGSIRQTKTQSIIRGEKRRTTEATKATVQEDKLSVERVLTGSLAVEKNWDPEEILRYQVWGNTALFLQLYILDLTCARTMFVQGVWDKQ